MIKVKTKSAKETEEFAESFAKELKKGDVIAFLGHMGAGKTAFVRGLAKGLNVSGEVCSPTFALVHEYPGDPTLVHFDMYRINNEDDLLTTGFYDYLDEDSIMAIEWSENIIDFLPENAMFIDIKVLGEEQRCITVTERGEKFENLSL